MRFGNKFKRGWKVGSQHDVAICITEDAVMRAFVCTVENIIEIFRTVLIAANFGLVSNAQIGADLSGTQLIAK